MNKITHSRASAMGQLFKALFKNYKVHMIFVMLGIVLSVAGSVGNILMTENVVSEVEAILKTVQAGGKADFTQLFEFIGIVGAVFAVAVIGAFMYTRLMAIVTQSFLADTRKAMFNKMQTLPIRFFDTNKTGDIMSVYTNDVDALRQMLSQSLPQVVLSVIMLLAALIIMLLYSLWLSIIILACAVIMVFISKHIAGKSVKYFVRQQDSLGKVNGYIEESLQGQKVIKVFVHEREAEKAFDKVNDELFSSAEKANKYSNILMPILANVGNLTYVIIAIIGAVFILTDVTNISLRGNIGTFSVSVVVMFLQLAMMFSRQVGMVSQQVNSIAMGIAGAQRIFTLIDEEPEKDNGYVMLVHAKYDENGELTESETRTGLWAWKHYHKATNTTTYRKLEGDIYIEHMDFGYTPDKLVLKDISLYAKPGQKVAFVGATGAGKTTITNLINRFYDIDDGKIRYDGININKIKKPDLRRSLGMVLQDINLFTGTIMENIRYGKLDATDEDCIKAAKIANAYDFISRLPDGFNTMLESDGANLSQGQRQLLSIARAAVADAPVMIMDEATSSIDTHTEKLVQDGMDKLMEGRTVFVIAHRLSTVRNSDVIMVLDHGSIIERGTHEQLIAKKGTYYQLYTGAFELE